MTEARVTVRGREDPLDVRVNGSRPTFRLAADRISAAVGRELDTRLLDLLDIAAVIFAADGTVQRGDPARRAMGSGWRRRFEIDIDVRHPNLWSRQDVCRALSDAVEFLTEDSVSFSFRQAVPDRGSQAFLDLEPGGATFAADEVIMFSGGLDSYAGALDTLKNGNSKVVLVTHRSAQKAIPRQVELGEYLSKRFAGRVLHLHVLGRRVDDEALDSTQRSRSFLFAALGQAVAHTFGAKRVSFFENGIISHNLPLSRQIVGTMATRTTHPLALARLNRLMTLAAPDPVPIGNSFQWLTKTEVVNRIVESGGAEQIPQSVSCTSIREQNSLHTHCGACSQCLDRRFAILAAGQGANDFSTDYATDVLLGKRDRDASRTMAVEWTRHMLRFGDLDERGAMAEFALELTRVVRGHPELPARTVLDQTLDMHRRQAEAVTTVLKQAMREHADDLVQRRLPATSLLAMWLGQTDAMTGALAGIPGTGHVPRPPVRIDDGPDIVPKPGAPLRVAFFEESGRTIVAVEGLGRVAGQPALVPHALKPMFDEDRQNGVEPVDHRFVVPTTLPTLQGMTKDAIRQNTRRCRATLAEYHTAIFGSPPPEPLLIQGQQRDGLRLDPWIEVLPAPTRD